MLLKSLHYSQYLNEEAEWILEKFNIREINLIVGKNASGKTRVLNVINNVAKIIRGEQRPFFDSANFDLIFEEDGIEYTYSLYINKGKVIKEHFSSLDCLYLSRESDGRGEIFIKNLNKMLPFQAPPSEAVINIRRDIIQHPFFEPLNTWANAVFHYPFGTSLGKDSFGIIRDDAQEADPRNASMVVGIFRAGQRKFDDRFINAIKADMKEIGYSIEEIGLARPRIINEPIHGELIGLWVKEKDIKVNVEQHEISQGMFRALSLIIQINYSLLAHIPSCILIDDIGEGLDFERSCALIKLLLNKLKGSSTQLIMTTNDRFVMNIVPLEMWAILNRKSTRSLVLNSDNIKNKMDDFRYTGLNNFDFFASNYFQ